MQFLKNELIPIHQSMTLKRERFNLSRFLFKIFLQKLLHSYAQRCIIITSSNKPM